MKVKLIQKNGGVFYRDLPDEWANRMRISIPKRTELTVAKFDISTPPNIADTQGEFEHRDWIKVGDELVKVIQEI